MNEELEKKFLLEEIKPLIDNYERYANQEIPYNSMIEENRDKQYANDEEGKILRSIDEELEKVIIARRSELIKAREKNIEKKRQEIYTKIQEFVDESKKEVNKEMEERNTQIQEKEEELKKYRKKILDIRNTIKKLQYVQKELKDLDGVYKEANEAEGQKAKELRKESEECSKILKDYNGMKEELGQLEEKRDNFAKIYGGIDFTSEKGIEDISKIVRQQQEKNLSKELKDDKSKSTITNPRVTGTSSDIKVRSIEELEKRRKDKEDEEEINENENEQEDEEEINGNENEQEDEEEKTVFPRIYVV